MSVDVSTASAAQYSGGGAPKTDSGAEIESFVNTGRTGRRNAIPDIHLDPNAALTTAGLAEQLHRLISEKLTGGDSCQCSCDRGGLHGGACGCECHVTGSSNSSTRQESLESTSSATKT